MLGIKGNDNRVFDGFSGFASFLLSNEGEIEQWNEEAKELFGLNHENTSPVSFFSLYAVEEQQSGAFANVLELAKGGEKISTDLWYTQTNGVRNCYRLQIKCLFTEAGAVSGFVVNAMDITELKLEADTLLADKNRLEAEILALSVKNKQSENRFLSLFQNNYDFISLKDENGTILYLSPSTIRIIGYTMEELQGRNAADFFHPDDVADVVARMEQAKTHPGEPIWGRNRMTHKDGHYIWVEGTTTNLINDENIQALVGNFRDITERKQAEEVIIESKAELENLFRGMGDAFLSINANWHITFANEKALNLINLPMSAFQGLTLWELFPGLAGSVVEEQYRKVMEERVPVSFETFYDRYNIWVEVRAYPHREGIAAFITDITLRKEAVGKIISSEHKFRALIENSADGISMFDADGTCIYQSLSAERINGFSFDEVKGEQATTMVHPDDAEKVRRVFKKALLHPGLPQLSVHRIKHKTKGWIYVEGTLNNLLHDEHVRAIVSNFRDITERREAELKIVHANRLYAFISNINQTILHLTDAGAVFQQACEIAVRYGKFKMAWIGLFNEQRTSVTLIAQSGVPKEDLHMYDDMVFQEGGAVAHILKLNAHYICNDFHEYTGNAKWPKYVEARGIKSLMILPIRKSGQIIGTFNLSSAELNFFDEEEVNLLIEAVKDISFALDVFEKDKLRREAEQSLIKSEFRLNEAQQIVHLGNWEIDFFTGRDIWSDEAWRILGYAPDSEGPSFESFMAQVHPDDMAYVKKVMKESEMEFKNASFNHRIIRQDGAVRHIYSESKFEYDSTGRTERLHGIIHDVTNSKIAEETLAHSEANLRLIMDLIPQPIFTRNLHGDYLFVNRCFAEYYGLSPQAMVGKNIYDIAPVREESTLLIQQDNEVINSGQIIEFPEIPFTDHKGNMHYFHSIKVPYVQAGKTEKAVLGISSDITESKQAEAERAQMIAEIVQRNKDLEQFSYIISHNLRSPVANILGITSLMMDDLLGETEQKVMQTELFHAAEKLDEVIKDINTVLQVKHEVGERKEFVRFSELCGDILDTQSKVIKKEHFEVKCDFSEINEVYIFKSYIYSIFNNLITNSVKYRHPDKIPLIEISSRLGQNKYYLTFRDNGLGIDIAKKGDQLFGLYKRFHAHVEGKGLGLYMVKMQVEALGGKISVESEVNIGTTFTIEFDYTEA